MPYTTRVVLRYDPGLADVDTWRLTDDGRGIVVRVRLGTGEISSTIDLRWRTREARAWPAAAYVAPADTDRTLWLTAPVQLGGGLLRRELQLERAPDHVGVAMSTW